MKELFSLGELYPSDFLEPGQEPRSGPIEMKLMMTDDGNVRLEKTAPPNTMFGRYFYRSGLNNSMTQELKDIAQSILKVKKLRENDIWLDTGSNDGTLLSFVPKDLIRIGVDPADDTYRIEAEKHANIIVQDFFSASSYQATKYGHLKAKVITSIAMFYDLEYPERFINDINTVLDDNGLWVLQLSYTPLMLEQLAFDNICSEHWYYYSLFNLKALFEKNGFQIVDCQLNDTNGGSFRVYAMKKHADLKTFATQPYRDVAKFRVLSLLEYEHSLELDRVTTWLKFFDRINALKKQTVDFIKQAKAEGKMVWGYGSSTKFNTLLQYFELDHTLIDAIAERSTFKYGLRTIGSNIPIVSEDEMRKAKPAYLLLGPWHFVSEFIERESEYLKEGKFIITMPKFLVIGGK
jgi:hypothetical protein